MLLLVVMLIVKYHGGNCFRLREGDSFLLLGNTRNKAKADIVIPDYDQKIKKNKVETIKREQVFWTPGPGEFEVRGVELESTGDGYWTIILDGWRVVWAMDGWQVPGKKKVEQLGQADVLFLTLNKDKKRAKEASELVKRISPYVVIPGMNWDDYEELGDDWTNKFLDEMDREDLKPIDKVKLKRSDINEEATEIYLLTA